MKLKCVVRLVSVFAILFSFEAFGLGASPNLAGVFVCDLGSNSKELVWIIQRRLPRNRLEFTFRRIALMNYAGSVMEFPQGEQIYVVEKNRVRIWGKRLIPDPMDYRYERISYHINREGNLVREYLDEHYDGRLIPASRADVMIKKQVYTRLRNPFDVNYALRRFGVQSGGGSSDDEESGEGVNVGFGDEQKFPLSF